MGTERERDRETERQSDRVTERQRDREIERNRDRDVIPSKESFFFYMFFLSHIKFAYHVLLYIGLVVCCSVGTG